MRKLLNKNKILLGAFLWLGAFAPAPALFAGTASDRAGEYETGIQYSNDNSQDDSSEDSGPDWQSCEATGDDDMVAGDLTDALAAYQQALALNPYDSDLEIRIEDLEAQISDSGAPSDAGGDSQSPAPAALAPAIIPVYHDGLASLDHARLWLRSAVSYNNASMTDLMNGVNATNQWIQNNGYSGEAGFDQKGFNLELEWGLLVNPNNGFSVGINYIRQSDLVESINYNSGSDFQVLTIQPQTFDLTLNYYFFIPDPIGRFFISAGGGLYLALFDVDNNFDFTNEGGSADEFKGELMDVAPGFQISVGHEFALSDRVGLSLFFRGRYAKLTHLAGPLTNTEGGTGDFGLAIDQDGTVDVPNTADIGGSSGNRYAAVDFTGFDVGLAVNLYSY